MEKRQKRLWKTIHIVYVEILRESDFEKRMKLLNEWELQKMIFIALWRELCICCKRQVCKVMCICRRMLCENRRRSCWGFRQKRYNPEFMNFVFQAKQFWSVPLTKRRGFIFRCIVRRKVMWRICYRSCW